MSLPHHPCLWSCAHDPLGPLLDGGTRQDTSLSLLGLTCLLAPLAPLQAKGRADTGCVFRGPHSGCRLGQSQPDKPLICGLAPTCPQQRSSEGQKVPG